MRPFGPSASYLTGKPVSDWRVGEWLVKRCSRKVFHAAVPTLAIDFSLGGLASLPVVLPGLPLYTLLRGTRRADARDHRVGGGKEEGKHVWVRAVQVWPGGRRAASIASISPTKRSKEIGHGTLLTASSSRGASHMGAQSAITRMRGFAVLLCGVDRRVPRKASHAPLVRPGESTTRTTPSSCSSTTPVEED